MARSDRLLADLERGFDALEAGKLEAAAAIVERCRRIDRKHPDVVALAAAMAALALAGPANAGWTTFGDTTAGPSIDTLSVNLKEVSKYTAVQGNIVRVTAYVSGLGAASGTQNVKAIVYRDSNGSPGARLGVSYEVTISAGRAWGWVVFPFLTPVPVHPSETVWIGFIASNTSDLTQAAITTPAGNQLLFNTDNYSGGPFYSLELDARNGKISFTSPNERISVSLESDKPDKP